MSANSITERSFILQKESGPYAESMAQVMAYFANCPGWLEEAARNLKPNGISPAIKRPEGVYFIQLADFTPSAPRPLAEVKGQIHDRLFKKVMDERFNFWLSEVKRTAHVEIRM